MTVVVGFVAEDGALMAADSESTEADGTRRDADKVWICGPLLMGHTGTSIVRQPLQVALAGDVTDLADKPRTRWEWRSALCEAAKRVFTFEYQNHVGIRGADGIPEALRGALLVIGRDDEGPWLLEIDASAGGTFYTDLGFHTVGSGSVAAQVGRTLLAHYEPLGRTLAHLRLIAHRTVATCIERLGGLHGVGGEVRMWESDDHGGFRKLDDSELRGIESGVQQWTTIEAESLNRVVVGGEDAVVAGEGESMPDSLEEAPAPTDTS